MTTELLTEALMFAEEVVLDSPVMTEGVGPGREWNVTVIKPGVSIKGAKWPAEVLAEAAPLYEGIKVGINARMDHEEDSGIKRSVVGFIDQIRTEGGKILGRLHLDKAPQELCDALVKAYTEGQPFGLSHVVHARSTEAFDAVAGRVIKLVQKILRPEFVDLVLRPSAGGRLEQLVAGLPADEDKKEDLPLGEPIADPAGGPGADDKAKTEVTPAEVAKLTEGLATLQTQLAEERKARETAEAANAVVRSAAILTEALRASDLPDKVQDAIKTKLSGRADLTTESVAAEITPFRTLLDVFAQRPGGAARRETAQVTAGEYDRYSDAMTESIFHTKTERDANGKAVGFKLMPPRVGRDTSPKRWYVDLTGDEQVTGKVQQGSRLTESIATTTFADIMGDSMTRAMLANYAQLNLDSWRQLVRINRVTDFRTQRRERLGGYANFPTVAQGAAYTAMTSPTDQEATYQPVKRGGTEDLTMETIANDDLGALREIPRRMGRAAAQTLHEFVFDFIKTNPACTFDSLALFHATHANLSANALSLPELVARRNAMLKQTDQNSSKRLAIRPRYLLAPIDLEELAYQLTTSDRVIGNNFNDPNFAKQFGITPIIVEYWTDANDWFLVCDPADAPTIEIGFFNGQETPEMFVQDQPTVGNVFTNDKITYKLRHIYGGSILDFRGFQGNVVA